MVPAAYLVNSMPVDASTSVRDATTTLAPCAAKPRHIARPMPRLPPVTSATLSRNVIAIPCAGVTPTLPCKHSEKEDDGRRRVDLADGGSLPAGLAGAAPRDRRRLAAAVRARSQPARQFGEPAPLADPRPRVDDDRVRAPLSRRRPAGAVPRAFDHRAR